VQREIVRREAAKVEYMISSGERSVPGAAVGREWRRDCQILLCKRCAYCDKLPKSLFSGSQRNGNHADEAYARMGRIKAL